MLLKHIVQTILTEVAILARESDEENGQVEVDKQMTEKTLDDEFEVSDVGLEYVKNVLERLNKKANKIGVAPLTLKVLKTRQEKLSDKVHKLERVINIHTIMVDGKSPIIEGYEFIASIEHTPNGNILNISPESSVKDLPVEYRTASATCDYCHTKRDRNNTYVLRNVKTGEFKRIGRNCLKNFFPDVNPVAILDYASILGKTLAALIGAGGMADDGFGGEGGGGSRNNYYDADAFLLDICLAYYIEGKRYVSKSAVRQAAEAGDTSKQSTAGLADILMNLHWQSKETQKVLGAKMHQHMSEAKALAEKINAWKDEKDWDAAIEEKPEMAGYFHNMKVIANSPAIQYKNAGYHASMLALYLRETEWNLRKAAEKATAATKSYVGKIGEKITFDGKVKKTSWFDTQYGTTFMYIFEDPNGNELVYFSSRDLNMEEGKTYKMKATVKDQRPSKYNNVPQTIITRGKVLESPPSSGGEQPHVSRDQWGNELDSKGNKIPNSKATA